MHRVTLSFVTPRPVKEIVELMAISDWQVSDFHMEVDKLPDDNQKVWQVVSTNPPMVGTDKVEYESPTETAEEGDKSVRVKGFPPKSDYKDYIPAKMIFNGDRSQLVEVTRKAIIKHYGLTEEQYTQMVSHVQRGRVIDDHQMRNYDPDGSIFKTYMKVRANGAVYRYHGTSSHVDWYTSILNMSLDPRQLINNPAKRTTILYTLKNSITHSVRSVKGSL